ncbi:MAG: hypothetical protein O2960_19465 [Verrucomicrobia bacterium]|nr:hypothetical protein [Verrucomicrobiota bacterium]
MTSRSEVEAAHQYSATRLEKGLTQLETGNELNKLTAAHLRLLAKDGDLDAVVEYLEKTKTI